MKPRKLTICISWFMLCLVLFYPPVPGAQNQTRASPPPPPLPETTDPLKPKVSITPSMAIVLACLVSAFLIMGCISVYVRQCTTRHMMLQFNSRPNDNINGLARARTAHGLDISTLVDFPTFLYSDVKRLKIGKEALECAVCLNEFEDDEILRLLPKCCHVFHPDCIGKWLSARTTCPVCRADLVPRPGELTSATILLSQDSGNDASIFNSGIRDSAASNPNNEGIIIEIQPVDDHNPDKTSNDNRPIGSNSSQKIPRSHTTGHSLVRPGENYDRFTLRLPEGVQSELLNVSLNKYRSRSAGQGIKAYERFYQEHETSTSTATSISYNNRWGWGFMRTPHFFLRTRSTRSESKVSEQENTTGNITPRRSVRSPVDKIFGGTKNDNDNNVDNDGERSFDRLRPDGSS